MEKAKAIMYCVKCGTQLEAEENFCPNCGNHVEGTEIKKKPVKAKENRWMGRAVIILFLLGFLFCGSIIYFMVQEDDNFVLKFIDSIVMDGYETEDIEESTEEMDDFQERGGAIL